jgi:hypothetical protein
MVTDRLIEWWDTVIRYPYDMVNRLRVPIVRGILVLPSLLLGLCLALVTSVPVGVVMTVLVCIDFAKSGKES